MTRLTKRKHLDRLLIFRTKLNKPRHMLRIAFVIVLLMSTGLGIGQEETVSASLIAYVTNKTCASGCYHIVILNPRTREERILTALPNNILSFGLAWRPHSDWLTFAYVQDNAIHLAMIESSSLELRSLGRGMNNLFDIAWSPDGKVLAFTALPIEKEMTVPLESDLFLIDATVGITARFSQSVSTFANIAWSPSSETIAVDGKVRLPNQPPEDDGYTDILLFERNGEFKIIGSPDVREYGASWTGDGRHIVYAAGDYETQQIYQADLAAGEITQLSDNADWKNPPHLVLQDSAVVYLSTVDITQTKVQLLDIETQEVKTVFAGKLTGTTLSPDGSQMAMIEITDNQPKLCVLDLQTGEKWCARHEPDVNGVPAWG